MYHYYEEDEKFISHMRTLCGDIVKECCHLLRVDENIGAIFYMVANKAGPIITQNDSDPITLNYTMEITRCDYYDNAYKVREAVRRAFNKALNEYGWQECNARPLSLTTEKGYYIADKDIEISIDLCITSLDRYKTLYLLTHKHSGKGRFGFYFWDRVPNSSEILAKTKYIKENYGWKIVRREYLEMLDSNLANGITDKPAVLSYFEAIANVYKNRNEWENRKPAEQPAEEEPVEVKESGEQASAEGQE